MADNELCVKLTARAANFGAQFECPGPAIILGFLHVCWRSVLVQSLTTPVVDSDSLATALEPGYT